MVTGAAQGIGRRIATALGEKGYALVLSDLREPDETMQELHGLGAPAVPVCGDISRETQTKQVASRAHSVFGRVDVLVNNAGISLISPVEDTRPDQWRRVLDVNLTAPFLLCRELGPIMLQQGQGSIINIASVAGLLGVADRAAYNASKHGLVGLTRTLAAEWGGRGVRCNAVCPGWAKTEMDAADQKGGTYTDADITSRIPMGRFAAPDDVAQAVVFLADPSLSGFVNGATLSVDGGWYADGSWESLRLRHR
ncbi:MAG: SDR family oxidoreductase [Chloroflexota bacterium]|nr:SDR family oxidoreductase [Chloroflexota bacterium]